ncbi:hypothetical protein ACCS87_02630 [Rhizobium ruizarguesonis]
MSQATSWSVPLSGPASPATMATRIDDSMDALLSAHSGAARPAYAVAGTIWISTATAGKLKKYLYDGTNDRLLETIDIATGAISYEPGTMTGPVNYANFAITNPAGKWLKGKISPGFNLANNATDATNDIDFPVGQLASDETTPILMDHAAGTAQLDVAHGTGNGGRFDSAISDGTWHCFVISNGTTVSRGFSKSLDPTGQPNYPSGYTHYRRVLSIVRSSGAILPFRQFENRVMLLAVVQARSSTAAFADALLAVTAPAGIRTRPILSSVLSLNASSSVQNAFGDGDASSIQYFAQVVTGQTAGAITIENIYTNTSSQIRYLCQINSGTIVANTLSVAGWWDDRG